MTRKGFAQTFAFSAVGMIFVAGVSACDDSCRDLYDGKVNESCAPTCETSEDCGYGELCVQDWADSDAKVCAQPCASSDDGCGQCSCSDGEKGYCGGYGSSYAMACRADGDAELWTQTICACQAAGGTQTFDACMQQIAEMRASIPAQCTPGFDELMFCFYRSLENVAGGCQPTAGQCDFQADMLAGCLPM